VIGSDSLLLRGDGTVRRNGIGPVVATVGRTGPPTAGTYRCTRTGTLRSGSPGPSVVTATGPLQALRKVFVDEDAVGWDLADVLRNGRTLP